AFAAAEATAASLSPARVSAERTGVIRSTASGDIVAITARSEPNSLPHTGGLTPSMGRAPMGAATWVVAGAVVAVVASPPRSSNAMPPARVASTHRPATTDQSTARRWCTPGIGTWTVELMGTSSVRVDTPTLEKAAVKSLDDRLQLLQGPAVAAVSRATALATAACANSTASARPSDAP